jgi:predicted fused transcriptional regulator/phosphomethylpyrimidine kinase/predicted transcriptional regulator
MQPPDELMVRQFLPALRLLTARSIMKQGYSQARVSSMLGITQASVSHYGSKSSDRAYASLASLSVSREEVERYVALLSEDLKRDPVYAVETLVTIWTSLLDRGSICEAHRRLYPSLVRCDVCTRRFRERTGEPSDTIVRVAEAVKLLESSPAFVSVMPEVSVNLASLAGESDSPENVVAIPGRIVRVRNSAKAMQPPALGSSKHMAKVLLLVRKRRPDFRAVINIRYDSKMVEVLKDLRLRILEIGRYSRSEVEDPTLEALGSKLLATKAEFDAVVDPGSRGIEPNLYLFGRDAMEVARLAVRSSELYSAH